MQEHTAVDATASLRAAFDHLVPGMAERHRVMGSGAVEVGAEGADVRLSDGRTVLDFGSYAVPLFGHRPDSVVQAVHRALDAQPTATRLVGNPYASDLARRLATTLDPARLTRVWLGLNGSDAVEAALKLAIAATGRPAVLAVEGGFHGKSMGALAVTADAERRRPVQGFLGAVRHLPLEPDAVREAAAQAPFAALIVEPVQGEGGGRILAPELLRRWAADAHAAGAFVIADEIQCGLRRCGPVSVALAEGLEPDAVLLGKALGGGVLPLSAAVCSADLFAPLVADPYFHTATFAGHPASCAAGLAALDLLDTFADRFAVTGAQLADGVAALGKDHPDVLADARCTGLFGVLEFATPAQAGLFVLTAARKGVLVAPCLTAPNTVRLLPPVVATDTQIASAMSIMDGACRAVRRRI